ncbi:MAG: hypothetical protein D6732_11590 [Methanobacteriota archaeon]|nr:MAG: hypothetical protein D6732_11590 [Euryarchaeota archaeon]
MTYIDILTINILKSISFLFAILAITTTISLGSMILLIFLLPFIALGVFYPRKIDQDMSFQSLKFASFLSQGIVSALFIQIIASSITLIRLVVERAAGGFIIFNTIISFLLLPLFIKETRTNSILQKMKQNQRELWLKSLEE